jgi:hypothetical protein
VNHGRKCWAFSAAAVFQGIDMRLAAHSLEMIVSWGNDMKIAVKHRFFLGLAIAVLWGAYTGMTYPYASLFAGNQHLYPLMLIPSLALGIVSGWKTLVSCTLMHVVVMLLFFLRALIGRPLTADYVEFVSRLIVGSVLEILPQALLWGYLMALVVRGVVFLYGKRKGHEKRGAAPAN